MEANINLEQELKNAHELLQMLLAEIVTDIDKKEEIEQQKITEAILHSSKKLHRILGQPFSAHYGENDYQKIVNDAKVLIDNLFKDKHFNTKTSDKLLFEVLQHYDTTN